MSQHVKDVGRARHGAVEVQMARSKSAVAASGGISLKNNHQTSQS